MVLSESVLLVGAFVPTLTLLLACGVLARAGDLNLSLVIAIASGAVVAGDFLGHRTGRLLGSRLRTGSLGRRIPAFAWRRAETLMERHGGQAVFLARFVAVVRTLAPHLAGATGLPYRRIAPYSLLAAPLWAGAEATAGYAAANSLQHVITLSGPALAAAAALTAGAALTTRRIRGRARARAHQPTATHGPVGLHTVIADRIGHKTRSVLRTEGARVASWSTTGSRPSSSSPPGRTSFLTGPGPSTRSPSRHWGNVGEASGWSGPWKQLRSSTWAARKSTPGKRRCTPTGGAPPPGRPALPGLSSRGRGQRFFS
ncbi:DedA family protein [Kitasatospora paranensis]|uniref:DedA family protein n=1 Tax=Kitasatospora paranensis TaxID=258053 RepID=UPI0031E729FD